MCLTCVHYTTCEVSSRLRQNIAKALAAQDRPSDECLGDELARDEAIDCVTDEALAALESSCQLYDDGIPPLPGPNGL